MSNEMVNVLKEELELALTGNKNDLLIAMNALIDNYNDYLKQHGKLLDDNEAVTQVATKLTESIKNTSELIEISLIVFNSHRDKIINLKGIKEVMDAFGLYVTGSAAIKSGINRAKEVANE